MPSLTHAPSGYVCLVNHGPGQGQCQRCDHCNEWIPPAKMDEVCPKRKGWDPGDPITMSRSALQEIRNTFSATDDHWRRTMDRMLTEYDAKCAFIDDLIERTREERDD